MNRTLQTLSLVVFTSAGVFQARAHDNGWATTGKILTGVIAGQAVVNAFRPPVYYAPPPPVVYAPAPVIVQPVQPVVYQAPVYVPPPAFCVPAPVFVRPPVYYAPAPILSVNFGFGHHHHHGHHGHH